MQLPVLPCAIEPESVLTVCEKFLQMNEGDEATQNIILAMTSDILNLSTEDIKQALPFFKNTEI